MLSMEIHSIRALACATALCVHSFSFAQDAVSRCASILPDAPALSRRSGPSAKYPDTAFAAGKEGTVGYQYKLIDAAGRSTVDCIYRSSGDAELDAAVVQRLNATTYYLPVAFDWQRDAGQVYQNTLTLSWNAENLARTKPYENIAVDRLLYEHPFTLPKLPYSIQGEGLFRGHVNPDGTMKMVSMLKSSGDLLVDGLAMTTMLAYKFKPGEAFSFDRTFIFKIN
jgi:outer membrane biosynthesis protein TonB